VSIKYIDASYIIRSVPANPHDSAFCLLLAHGAAHAGTSGRTNTVVSFWNHQFMSLAAPQRKKIDPEGTLWNSVLASTGRPWKIY
jgi:6-phosphofructokinase 1